MMDWKRLLRTGLSSGQAVGMATAATSAACGQVENGNAIAPLNAMSHLLWGEEAAAQDEFSVKYTLAGLALCTSANAGWAALYEKWFGPAADEGETGKLLLGAVAVAAIAYVVDYILAPPRFTPGLEKRLSRRSILLVYLSLAIGLAVSGLRRSRR